MKETILLLDHGSGGRASQRLVNEIFLRHFGNPILEAMDDAAFLPIKGPVAMSTDAYTVTPLFFPGGSIGTLAVHGTVNDVSMLGAKPLYLSCAFILEEGIELETIDRVVQDMARAAKEAGVLIVTGDTKVVPRGACDKMFITTSGIGQIIADPAPSGSGAKDGDAVLLSGTIGDHGLTIFNARENLGFIGDISSDSAPLNSMIERLILEVGNIHTLRDPTRGGLSSTLNEIAAQSGTGIMLREADIPVREAVKNGCSFLGLDPLQLANEGKFICILPENKAEAALAVMRADKNGADAARIGTVGLGRNMRPGQVVLETALGGHRLLSMPEGGPLPRIC